jgi:hypothetical protein
METHLPDTVSLSGIPSGMAKNEFIDKQCNIILIINVYRYKLITIAP